MAVKERRRVLAQRSDDGRPDREVGNEMAVHHVDMKPVSYRRDVVGGLCKLAEVGGEDRRVDPDLSFFEHASGHYLGSPFASICDKSALICSGRNFSVLSSLGRPFTCRALLRP